MGHLGAGPFALTPIHRNGQRRTQMTKAEIAQQLAHSTGLCQVDTAAVIEGFIEAIAQALSEGDRVELRGFGTFKVVDRAPRTGRNPKAGATIAIPKRKAPTFKPSDAVKSRIVQRAP